MVELEPRTLLVACVFVTLTGTAAMSVFWFNNRPSPPIGYAALGLLAAGLALVGYAMRDIAPPIISISLANALLALSALCILSATRILAGHQALPAAFIVLVIAITVGWLEVFRTALPSLTMRLGYMALLTSLLAFAAARYCLYRVPNPELAQRIIGWVLLAHGTFVAIASAVTVLKMEQGATLFSLRTLIGWRVLEATVVIMFIVALLPQIIATRLRRQVEADAVTDSLTGLFNRRGFEDSVRRKLMRRSEDEAIYVFAIADIDHFKAVNDRFGHQTGDRVLAAVATALRSTLRPSERLGRIGGEEFALLVRVRTAADAAIVAERLRSTVEALRVEVGGGTTVEVTLSCGYSTVTLPAGSPAAATVAGADRLYERLYRKADGALYEAKHSGRNCVLDADEEHLTDLPSRFTRA